jgi:putative ABC transport system substrate-binding protein
MEAISAPVNDGSEIDSVFAAQSREPNSGLIAMPDPFTLANRVKIVSLAARYRSLSSTRTVSSLKSAVCWPTA